MGIATQHIALFRALRLAARVAAVYNEDPLLAALLRLSERDVTGEVGRLPPDRQLAADRLHANGIAFIMLNRATESPALTAYVEHVLPVTTVAREGERALYLVSS